MKTADIITTLHGSVAVPGKFLGIHSVVSHLWGNESACNITEFVVLMWMHDAIELLV